MGIKEFFTGLWRGISNVLRDSDLMQKLLPMLGVAIPPPWDLVVVVAVEAISAALGTEEKPDELGWQMNQADKKPEDFGSFKEYKEYLDKNYPFDEERYAYLTDEEKTMCRYIGLAGTMKELKESKGFELTPESLGILVKGVASLKWDDAQIGAFAKGMTTSLLGSGIASLGDIESLAKGTLDPDREAAISGAIGTGAKAAGVKQDAQIIVASLQE